MNRTALFLSISLLGGCTGAWNDPAACKESGTVCVIAGDGNAAYNGDGLPARKTQMYFPMDVTIWPDNPDKLAVVDWNNERIRMIDEDGRFSTIVGRDVPGDGDDRHLDRVDPGVPGTDVSLNHPVQVEFAPDGRMYIAAWHNHKVRRWDPETGLVRIVVANTDPDDGNGSNSGFDGDGGPAEDALVWFPSSIVFTDDGTMYFADEKNLRIRRVTTDQVIDTVAGSGGFGYVDGSALEAQFQLQADPTNPQPLPGGAVDVGPDGNIYIADTCNSLIRKLDLTTGQVSTVAGTGERGYSGDGGDALAAELNEPRDIEFGPDGLLYVADSVNNAIRVIDVDAGTIDTFAGTGAPGKSDDGDLAADAPLNGPYGLDIADDGAMYIADTFNSTVLRVTP